MTQINDFCIYNSMLQLSQTFNHG